MGQKVSPHGLRVGVIKDWNSKWYGDKKNFADFLAEDNQIREYVKKILTNNAEYNVIFLLCRYKDTLCKCSIGNRPTEITNTNVPHPKTFTTWLVLMNENINAPKTCIALTITIYNTVFENNSRKLPLNSYMQ